MVDSGSLQSKTWEKCVAELAGLFSASGIPSHILALSCDVYSYFEVKLSSLGINPVMCVHIPECPVGWSVQLAG